MKTKQDRLDTFFMTCALSAADLSLAKRSKVGAILVKDGRIISTGYNGQPSGFDNCCEELQSDGSYKTKSTVIHAEMNAILFCAKHGTATQDTTLYITLSPCSECVKAIIQAGIVEVIYLEPYRDLLGLTILTEAGIKTRQYF